MTKTKTPALLIRKSNNPPLRWLVQFMDKELYFESLIEAMKFCKGLNKAGVYQLLNSR